MKRSILPLAGALVLAMGIAYAPPASAQASEFSTWTINEPTEVSGTVLQPGTYRLSVMRTPTSRNFVRVMSEDGQTLYTTALTVPRVLRANEDMPNNMFVYYPAAPGQPRVLRTWFAAAPPGGIGHDFVYDERRARELARRAETPVVTYRGTVETAELDRTDLYVVTPDERMETYVIPAPVVPERTEVAGITETRVAARTELPRTASSNALLALLGMVAVAGAFAIRFMIR
jgi:hypothetical protein